MDGSATMRGLGGFAWDPLGVPIVESVLMVEQVRKQIRFPRSKRKRVMKKWSRYERNWITEIKPCAAFVSGVGIVVHPDIARALREKIR